MLKKQKISKKDALNGVPIKNPAVMENCIDTKTLQLTYPVLPGKKISAVLAWCGKNSRDLVRHKTIELDLLGSRVWNLIDDRATVKEISAVFCDEFQLETSEAQVSVSLFLRELGRRNIIAIG